MPGLICMLMERREGRLRPRGGRKFDLTLMMKSRHRSCSCPLNVVKGHSQTV